MRGKTLFECAHHKVRVRYVRRIRVLKRTVVDSVDALQPVRVNEASAMIDARMEDACVRSVGIGEKLLLRRITVGPIDACVFVETHSVGRW